MMVSEDQINQLAELLWLGLMKGRDFKINQLKFQTAGVRDEYRKRAGIFIDSIEKMNLKIVPASLDERPRREVAITQVEHFIKEFIEKKVKVPVGLVGIFPYQALAYDLVKEFEI